MLSGVKAVCLLMLLSAQSSAQQGADTALNGFLAVHTQYGKEAFAQVPADSEFATMKTVGPWTLVKFSEPVVPVWASQDYLVQEGSTATIVANRLNLRMGASIESRVLGSGERGYISPVLNAEGGFAEILAPTSMVYWLRTADIKRLSSSVSSVNTPTPSIGSRVAVAQKDKPETSNPKVMAVDEAEQIEAPTTSVAPSDAADSATGENRQTSQTTSSQTTNQASADSELDAAQSSRDLLHRLSPGDTISLRVFGEQDLSVGNVRIPQSGTVSFPLIGSYNVVGKSVEELEDQLREVLSKGYVRNPRLSISIDSYRPIFVLGAAQKIGSFDYSEGLTIAKAIAVAGGAKNSAKSNGVSVLRDGQVIEEGLPINSTKAVRSGDIISIEEELGVDADGGSYVYLHGEVRSPGEYKFRRGLTVEKAVVLAGGFTLRASRRKISVSRVIEGEASPEKLKKVALHMPIEPGDIIDVGASWF